MPHAKTHFIPSDIAKLEGVTPACIRQCIRRGELRPDIVLSTGARLFTREEVERWRRARAARIMRTFGEIGAERMDLARDSVRHLADAFGGTK